MIIVEVRAAAERLLLPGIGQHRFALLRQQDIAFLTAESLGAHLVAGTAVEHRGESLEVLRRLGQTFAAVNLFIRQLQHPGALVEVGLGPGRYRGIKQGQALHHFRFEDLVCRGAIAALGLLRRDRGHNLLPNLFSAPARLAHDPFPDQPGIGRAAFDKQGIVESAGDAALLFGCDDREDGDTGEVAALRFSERRRLRRGRLREGEDHEGDQVHRHAIAMKSMFRQLAIEWRHRTRQKPPVSKLQDMITRYPYGISLLAGGISATGFAPLNLWPLTLLMLALWMVILMQAQSRKAAFFAGWLFGLGHFIIGLNWIAKAFTFQAAMPGWMGYVAVVLLSLYLAVFPALAAVLAWSLGRKSPWAFILALAGTWIITEWLRSWVFSGFIWNPLSVTLPSGLWAGSALVGTYGLAAVAIIVAGLCVQIAVAASGRRWRQTSIMMLPVIVILALAAVMSPGAGAGKAQNGSPITIVQPNIGQQDKWKAGYEADNLAKLAGLTTRKDSEPRILFWPEAAIPDYLETGYPARYYYGRPPEMVRQQLGALMKPGDVLVLGALKLEFDEAEGRAVGARNSVFAMDQQGELLGRYDKSHLVPYGEYLPMRPLLSAIGLSRLVPGDFDFWPGPGARSLDLGKFGKAGLQVCYEIIFSGQVVDRDNRPDFIFNPSNDAWFGEWGPPQHLAQARLRAIEEGLPVIRSTPTGISALIDADGAIVASVPMGQAGRIDANLPPAKSPTVFARYGQILPLAVAIFLLLSAIAIRVRGR